MERFSGGTGESARGGGRVVVYCIIPGDLAGALHESLRRHFRDDPGIQVIVEQRVGERRVAERRVSEAGPPLSGERRRIRSHDGRRVGDRRAALAPIPAPELPRKARPFAERILFVELIEPSSERLEDIDTAHLVTRIQAGEKALFADLYRRYFDRVYTYLRLIVRDPHESEDLTQQVFLSVMQTLPRYERREQPFRAWLFIVVRNHALTHLRKQGRLSLLEPDVVEERVDETGSRAHAEPTTFDWITDRDLTLFVERLPLVQRQVLVLRYLLGLSHAETAQILDRTPGDVRKMQSRALRYLRQRLGAVAHRGEGRIRRDRTSLRARKQAPVLRMRRFSLSRW